MSEWEVAPATAPWEEEPPKSTWQQIKSMVPKLPYGPALEAATGFVSGQVAPVVGGITGLAGAVLPGKEGQGADWVRATQDALTYEPESKAAQKALHYAGLPFEMWGKGADWAGGKATDWTGSPLVGTAVNTAINAVPLALGVKLPGMKASAFEHALPGGELPGTPAARTAAMVENLQRDNATAAANRAGFKVPPATADPTSWINQTLEFMGGRKRLAQDLSKENQPKMQDNVRAELGMGPHDPLTPKAYEAVRAQEAQAYPELTEALQGAPYSELPRNPSGLPTRVVREQVEFTPKFREEVGARRDQLRALVEDKPVANKGLNQSLDLLDEALAKNHIDPDFALSHIQGLREVGNLDIKSATPSVAKSGETRLQLANDLERVIEQNLTDKRDFASLAKFRRARTQIAKAFDAENATLPTGEINAKSFADAGPQLTGGLKDIADLQRQFPEVTQIPTRVERAAPSNPVGDAAGAAASAVTGSRFWPAVGDVVQGPIRSVLKSDWYQNKMATPPSYGPSIPSQFVRGLQQPGVLPGLESLGLSERRRKLLEQLLMQGAGQ